MNTELLKSKLLEAAFNGSLTHADTSKWETFLLGEIFSMKAGKFIAASQIQDEQSEDNPYPCYGGNDIRGYVKDYNTAGEYPIIGRQGALCGNVKYASGKFYATEHAVVVRNIKEVDTKWAFYALTSLNLNQYATSTAQPGLSVKRIEQVPLSLPPFIEQKQIVASLEEGFAAIDAIAEAKENLSTTAEMLRSKILQAAFDGSLTGADTSTWENKPLGEFVDIISGTSYEKSDVQEDGIRVLRGGNIQNNVLVLEEDDVFVPVKYRDNAKCIKNGDIIIVASTGSQKAIGKPALIREDYEDVQIGAFLRIVRPKGIQYAPYIQCFFLSPLYRDYIRMQAKGTNINNIKNKYLTDLVLPMPSISEQQRIVAKIEELFAEIDKLTK